MLTFDTLNMHKKIALFLLLLICAVGTGSVNAQEIAVKQIGGCQGNRVLLAATTHSSFLGWQRADGTKTGIFSPDSLVTWVQVEERTIFKATAGSAQSLGVNLIKNGDFENDTVGLRTGYKYKTPRTDKAGDYIVTNNPNVGRSTPVYALIGDHTSGIGKMFMADGDTGQKTILSMALPVTVGSNYTFQIWIANIHKKLIEPNTDTSERKLPRLLFRIDGNTVGEYKPPFDSLWHAFSKPWVGTKNGTVTLEIIDLEKSAEGNDFVLDDISFRQNISSSIQQASITVDPCLRTDVFSPDGDGVLDSYYIEEKGVAKIYDLDGNLIHELFTPTHWDGTKRTGGLADAGYYAVVINDNKSYRVSLMR